MSESIYLDLAKRRLQISLKLNEYQEEERKKAEIRSIEATIKQLNMAFKTDDKKNKVK